MIKKLFSLIFILMFFSCKKDIQCSKKYIDEGFITTFLVTKDTCNTFNNYSKVTYYKNDTIIMSGYGNRISKQGHWEFFKNGKIYTEGLFVNSEPVGKWSYGDHTEIEWMMYKNEQNYSLSIPKNWTFYNDESGITIFDSPKAKDSNLYINVYVMESKDSLLDWITKIKENEMQKGSNNFIYKKLNVEGFEDGYEIQTVSKVEDVGFFQSKAFLFSYKGKIYRIFGNVKQGADYRFNIIREQIFSSFKIKSLK